MSNSEFRVSMIVAALMLGAFALPASALTMKQCSEKYKLRTTPAASVP